MDCCFAFHKFILFNKVTLFNEPFCNRLIFDPSVPVHAVQMQLARPGRVHNKHLLTCHFKIFNIKMLASKSNILACKLHYIRALSTTSFIQKPAAPKLNLSNTESPENIRSAWFAATFPIQKLTDLLDHDNHEMRQKFRKFISEPIMIPRYNIALDEERDLALRRLQRICDNNFISVLDFRNNPLRIFAAHELAAIIDPAMTTKMTVQVKS